MRFGISAISSILPKNLRTRLRPVNVCAIVGLVLRRAPCGDGFPTADQAVPRERYRSSQVRAAVVTPAPRTRLEIVDPAPRSESKASLAPLRGDHGDSGGDNPGIA